MGKWRSATAKIRNEGLVGTVSLIRKNAVFAYRLWRDRQFDRTYGTDTSGRVELSHLTVVGENRERGVYFESTPTALFRFFLSNLRIDFSEFTFIDLGSGKGRTLLLASDYPFKRIIGVEFCRELHDCALLNLRVYRSATQRCTNLISVHADATQFEFPQDPLLVYAYNPFDEFVMTAVMTNLVNSIIANRRNVVLLYYNPRWWVMESVRMLTLRAKLDVPYDPTREVQRPAAVYSNFEMARGDAWLDP